LFSSAFWSASPGRREQRAIAIGTLAILAALILACLGHYPLWDDEANTALFGQSVWRTGDTSAVIDHNLLAYRSGAELDGEYRNRHIPPLQYFVAAPFVRDTHSAWWARLPFALAGIATIVVLLVWLARSDVSRRTWVLSSLALIGNVSFILFTRQSRYYALTMLCSVLLAYAYAHRERGRRMLVLLALAGAALLGSQYLCYAGMVAALGVDYLIWGRKSARIDIRAMLAIGASQLVAAAAIVGTWFPVQQIVVERTQPWLVDRIQLWMKTLRDLNSCEFGVGLLLLAAPLLFRRAQDLLLRRLSVAILVATFTVTAFSPQASTWHIADIRYACFLIPACLLLCVRAIEALRLPGIAPLVLGVIAFQTTLLHWLFALAFSPLTYEMPVRSTLFWYIRELRDPPPSAFAMAADWLRPRVKRGETAMVTPEFATYPLMFHVPDLVYGWQFKQEKAPAFPNLPPIQIEDRVAPDWVITYSMKDLQASKLGKRLEAIGGHYELAAELPITGIDATRPELFWRRFYGKWYTPRAPLTIWRKRTP
jgi:hypothetical protein